MVPILPAVILIILTANNQVTASNYSACEQPVRKGPCKALFIRYFYDSQTKRCENFMYGGCDGNDNNFETLDACQSACMTSQKTQPIDKACALPKDVGPCEALIPRYYFDIATGQCQNFYWGGCQGNGNNFEILTDCQVACMN